MKKILCLCLVLALLPICGMAEIVSLDEPVSYTHLTLPTN